LKIERPIEGQTKGGKEAEKNCSTQREREGSDFPSVKNKTLSSTRIESNGRIVNSGHKKERERERNKERTKKKESVNH
jgi:hypothetical protein